MLKIKNSLETHIRIAFEVAFPEITHSGKDWEPQLVPASKVEFGDFQVNGALSLAKILKKPPRQIAEDVVNELKRNEKFLTLSESPTIAGPGFINIKIKISCLTLEIKNRLKDKRLGVPLIQPESKSNSHRIVVDFSSPNIAKEMHVGHLRSTIIGDSLARVLEFRGYDVLRLNHVGDWGTQFGMLITHLKKVAPQALTEAEAIDLGDLVSFYRQAKKEFDKSKTFQNASREEVVKLQQGDPVSLKAWTLLCSQSRKEFQKIYDRLNIRISERGESFYNPYLANVISELENANLLVTDDGAKCVFLEGLTSKDGKPLPLIVQKKDGGFNYATTDLAALRYRLSAPPNGDGAYRLLYITDAGQANHFTGVFQVARRANWIPNGSIAQHVPFGLVQGDDGKKLKTRSGDTVRLKDLLDESIKRAKQDIKNRLKAEDRNETSEFINTVSSTVGLASVKYADLSQNRMSNYQFSFERMLSLQGNTAPYLLYAIVRIAGIVRKAGHSNDNSKVALQFNEEAERSLIRELLKFDEVIIEVEKELLPNRLCSYLFELSQTFNRFYDQIPVLKAKEPFKSHRLSLCKLTADTLKTGLDLLGIPTLERM